MELNHIYVITGTVIDSRTVRLDDSIPLQNARVRVSVEPLSAPKPRFYLESIVAIRQRQEARGYRAPTPDQVDAYLQAERSSWGE